MYGPNGIVAFSARPIERDCVNDDDVTIVSATYAPGVPQASWALGDFDYNGFVDDDDVTLLGVFYDPGASPLAGAAHSGAAHVAAIPEPTPPILIATALVGLAIIAVFHRTKLRVVLICIMLIPKNQHTT